MALPPQLCAMLNVVHGVAMQTPATRPVLHSRSKNPKLDVANIFAWSKTYVYDDALDASRDALLRNAARAA